MSKLRNPLLMAISAFVLGGIVTTSLTTARAQDPAQTKTYDYDYDYDYDYATSPGELGKYGKEGYAIINVTQTVTGWPTWTLQRK
jgi:hypothetical protein